MLEKNYQPFYNYHKAFQQGVKNKGGKPFFIALERGADEIKVHKTEIYAVDSDNQNLYYVERLVKTMLWSYGGYKFTFFGDNQLADSLREIYSMQGERAFDYEFMAKVYQQELTFVSVDTLSEFPTECEKSVIASANKTGYRIGFDAGGSDRKVTACIDGEVIFEKEIIWHPKLHNDPQYHIDGIADSIDMALEKLDGRVDSIGVSSAGIVIDREIRVASLFRKVSEDVYQEKIFPIYKNLEKKYNCPVKVANDGDIAALSGAFQLNKGKILGIAMGTSLAGGYVGEDMDIKGYLNELAFIPVDASPTAAIDEWSGDRGVGGLYHSQDGVIRLAEECGIPLIPNDSRAEKLKTVQKLVRKDDPRALAIFDRMGDFFGYTILWLQNFYDIDEVVFMGRAASERGGDMILEKAQQILASEGSTVKIVLPDEMPRRLGQSYTATLL